jgi:hypothetical protein
MTQNSKKIRAPNQYKVQPRNRFRFILELRIFGIQLFRIQLVSIDTSLSARRAKKQKVGIIIEIALAIIFAILVDVARNTFF